MKGHGVGVGDDTDGMDGSLETWGDTGLRARSSRQVEMPVGSG